MAKKVDGDMLEHYRCGTPSYIAPEILRCEGYSLKADIFSIGSIMYNLATGKYLFHVNKKDSSEQIILNRDCNLSHLKKNVKHLSSEGKNLIKKLLDKDPS